MRDEKEPRGPLNPHCDGTRQVGGSSQVQQAPEFPRETARIKMRPRRRSRSRPRPKRPDRRRRQPAFPRARPMTPHRRRRHRRRRQRRRRAALRGVGADKQPPRPTILRELPYRTSVRLFDADPPRRRGSFT